MEVFLELVLPCFGLKENKYKILNNFLLTIKFSQSLESTKNTVPNTIAINLS